MELLSIYDITELSKGATEPVEDIVEGAGERVVRTLRKKYHRFTKFVLRGFLVDGRFIALKTRNRY